MNRSESEARSDRRGRTWVTRREIHLDRVATAWLITRFVDPAATFVFITPGLEEPPADAIPFALPGSDLPPHDAEGSTFRKVLRKYSLEDAALIRMATIIEAAVDITITGRLRDTARAPEGAGISAFSEGVFLAGFTDQDVLARSLPIYEALYLYCCGKELEMGRGVGSMGKAGERLRAIRTALTLGTDDDSDRTS